jgi:hypothetical protein
MSCNVLETNSQILKIFSNYLSEKPIEVLNQETFQNVFVYSLPCSFVVLNLLSVASKQIQLLLKLKTFLAPFLRADRQMLFY